MRWARYWQATDLRRTDCRAIFLLFVVLLWLVCYMGAQGRGGQPNLPPKSEWIFNFTGAALEIRETAKTTYELTNQSSVKIEKYALGCVRLGAKNQPTIVYRFRPEQIEIEPGQSVGTLIVHGNPDRCTCEKRNSRLSVTDVTFENSVEWHAPADQAR